MQEALKTRSNFPKTIVADNPGRHNSASVRFEDGESGPSQEAAYVQIEDRVDCRNVAFRIGSTGARNGSSSRRR